MTDTINIGKVKGYNDDVNIKFRELINGRTFLSATSGYGKSWTVRKICEEVYGKTGIVIIDPEGEYASLREKFPFLIIGQDVPLEVGSAEFMAEQVLKNDISVIIDLSITGVNQGQEFIRRFTDKFMELQTKMKKCYLLVIEEANELIPEKGTFQSNCLKSLISVVKKGRKRNVGVIVSTQRAAFVSKYAISQCNNKIIGRTEWPDDKKVIQKFLMVTNETVDTLATVNKGEFLLAGDFIVGNIMVKVGQVKTTHTGESPDMIPPSPKSLQEIMDVMKKNVNRITEDKLKPEIEKRMEIENRVRKDVEKELEGKYKQKVFDLEQKVRAKPILSKMEKDKRLVEMEKIIQSKDLEAQNAIESQKMEIKTMKGELERQRKFMVDIRDKIDDMVKREPKEMDVAIKPSFPNMPTGNFEYDMGIGLQTKTPPNTNIEEHPPFDNGVHQSGKHIAEIKPKEVSVGTFELPRRMEIREDESKSLGRCEKTIYKFLYGNLGKGFTKVQVGGVTGYSHKSGGFNNALSRLNALELIVRSSRFIYARSDNVQIGKDLMGEELERPEKYSKEIWLQKLGKCPRVIYGLLLEHPDKEFTKEQIGEILEYSHMSGGFNNAISRLNSLGLIDRNNGMISLSEEIKGV